MNPQFRSVCISSMLFLFTLVTACFSQDTPVIENTPDLFRFLEKIENTDIRKIEIELRVKQPIDHEHPETGNFYQRVFLIHKGANRPMAMETEGYQARPHIVSELSSLLDANQIHVEHRYFGESTPDSMDYKYLTIRQAAADHHRIIELFKSFYTGPWLTFGISKGGQTAMYHKRFYPADVQATVCYVSPLNFSRTDDRIDQFLKSIAPDSCLEKIYTLQTYLLSHREDFMPFFREHNSDQKYEFSMGDSVAWEYCVLEYPFAFWQWQNADCNSIPDTNATTASVFRKFIKVSTPYYFADKGRDYYAPFFVQALSEIGYYGYDLEPFAGKLKYITDGSYRFSLPANTIVEFDSSAMQDINERLAESGNNMIYIYGANDPWGAAGVQLSGKTNALKFVLANGSHATRIRDLSENDRRLIRIRLEEWLDLKIENPEVLK